MTFYAVPMLAIDTDDEHMGEWKVNVEVGGAWKLLDQIPGNLPTLEDEDGQDETTRRQRISELIATVGALCWHPIVDARLGDEVPHLLLTFSNGQTLYINGHNDRYESWNISAGQVVAGKGFLVVAGPQHGLAIWKPDSFPASD